MTELFADNSPNKSPIASYEEYRRGIDALNGQMRTGICTAEDYDTVLQDESTVYGEVDGKHVPILSSRGSFELGSDGVDAPPMNALVPFDYLPDNLRSGVRIAEQFSLAPEQIARLIYSGKENRLQSEEIVQMVQGRTVGELAGGHGEPEFMLLSRYDLTGCDSIRQVPPEDIITTEGHIITTKKEKILAHLDELVELHEDVFRQQAVRIGYYDGLYGGIIEELMGQDNFIGAAAFDKDSGKPIMFAIFGSNLEAADSIPWVNKGRIQELIDQNSNDEEPIVGMPLVITSRFTGLGLYPQTVQLALQEMLYRSGPTATTGYTQFSASLESALYTPRIINSVLVRNGASLIDCTVEATVVTDLKNTASESEIVTV